MKNYHYNIMWKKFDGVTVIDHYASLYITTCSPNTNLLSLSLLYRVWPLDLCLYLYKTRVRKEKIHLEWWSSQIKVVPNGTDRHSSPFVVTLIMTGHRHTDICIHVFIYLYIISRFKSFHIHHVNRWFWYQYKLDNKWKISYSLDTSYSWRRLLRWWLLSTNLEKNGVCFCFF